MPQPPILPTIDWKSVYNSGKTYDDWIAGAENPDHRDLMKKLLAEQKLEPQQEGMLGALPRAVHVIAIAEDWCGDVVRHVPVLQRIAQAAPKLGLRFISRAQHKDVFIRFLTNGGEAIPKFVFLSDQFVECGNWGPMPDDCREWLSRGKGCGDVGAARAIVSKLYEADKGRQVVVRELIGRIDIAASSLPPKE